MNKKSTLNKQISRAQNNILRHAPNIEIDAFLLFCSQLGGVVEEPCNRVQCDSDYCQCPHVLHIPLGSVVQLVLAITVSNPGRFLLDYSVNSMRIWLFQAAVTNILLVLILKYV